MMKRGYLKEKKKGESQFEEINQEKRKKRNLILKSLPGAFQGIVAKVRYTYLIFNISGDCSKGKIYLSNFQYFPYMLKLEIAEKSAIVS